MRCRCGEYLDKRNVLWTLESEQGVYRDVCEECRRVNFIFLKNFSGDDEEKYDKKAYLISKEEVKEKEHFSGGDVFKYNDKKLLVSNDMYLRKKKCGVCGKSFSDKERIGISINPKNDNISGYGKKYILRLFCFDCFKGEMLRDV